MFVTNTRLIFFKHCFFGRGETEDLHYRDIVSVNVKIGILSCDLRIKSRFGGNDRDIEIHAVQKDKGYRIEAIINNGIARAEDGRGRFSEP
ncbi:MAG: PH domain-containing protein [Candidatus Nitrosopolaris sp.]